MPFRKALQMISVKKELFISKPVIFSRTDLKTASNPQSSTATGFPTALLPWRELSAKIFDGLHFCIYCAIG
jgi:hypothetical protein